MPRGGTIPNHIPMIVMFQSPLDWTKTRKGWNNDGPKGVKRIASIGVLSAGLVLSTGLSGYIGEVSAEESVKVLNKYQEAPIYKQEDVLKALEGYNGDKSKKGLIEYGLKTGDMRLFYAVDAMLRPAFYDVADGRFEKNKYYYGTLIEKHIQSADQYPAGFGYAAGVKHEEKEDKRFGIDYSKFGKDDYFEKIEWIDRKGILSLSIYPKFPAFKKGDGKLDEQRIKHSFDVIESEYAVDEKWNNTDSMRVQYECHVYFAGDGKVPWNIEPHRTESRFLETVLNSCNP